MTRMQKGYEIPDPIDPGDAICVRIYVPNDRLYIAAFWAAYEHFTTWIAWEKDNARRGKDAAAVWRKWYDLARADFAAGLGCGDWYQPSPYAGEDPDQVIIKVASDWVYYFRDGLIWPAIVILNDGGSAEDAANYLIDKMSIFGPSDVTSAAWEMATALFGRTTAQRIDTFDNADWDGFYGKAACQLVPYDGALGDDAHWLDTLANEIISWLGATSDWIFEMLESTAALLTGSTAMRAAWDADGGGSGYGYTLPVCGWSQDFIFTAATMGWVPFDLVYPRAIWVSGFGWHTLSSPGGVCKILQIERQGFAPTMINTVKLEMTQVPDLAQQVRANTYLAEVYGVSISPPTTLTPIFVINNVCTGLWVSLDMSDTCYDGYLTKIVVTGEGTNPFIV